VTHRDPHPRACRDHRIALNAATAKAGGIDAEIRNHQASVSLQHNRGFRFDRRDRDSGRLRRIIDHRRGKSSLRPAQSRPPPLINQATGNVVAGSNVLNLGPRRKRLSQNLQPLLIRSIPAASRPRQHRYLRHGCP
jgi:hypothetical protein